MLAFAYPKVRHQRNQVPGHRANYSDYKPYLQIEFDRRCVYCRAPDPLKGYANFGVDHYRPKSRFELLATEYLNLYYCCNDCNRRKGSHWPSAEEEAIHFVPNPCEHVMFQHLRAGKDGKVEARTPAGEFTVELLHLNDDLTVNFRMAAMQAIELLRNEEAKALRLNSTIERRRKAGTVSVAKAEADTAAVTKQLLRTRSSLAVFCELPEP